MIKRILLLLLCFCLIDNVSFAQNDLEEECVFCIQVVPNCKPGQRLVPQTCKECAHCVDIEEKAEVVKTKVSRKCKCLNGKRWNGFRCVIRKGGKKCKEEIKPVCGCDGKTYSNKCLARLNGIRKCTKGPCEERKTNNSKK